MRISVLVFATILSVSPLAAAERIVTIVNNTSYDIVDFYAANRDDRGWGGSFLPGREILPAGYELDVDIDDGTGYCVFDFMAVFSDGVTARKNGMDICALDVFYFDG